MLLREKTAEAVGKTWLSQSDTQGKGAGGGLVSVPYLCLLPFSPSSP